MKDIRKIIGIMLLTALFSSAAAQQMGCTVKKSFKVKDGTWITVSNKYGDLTFITTTIDSVIICATVSVQQEDRTLADKSASLVKCDSEKNGDTISVVTRIDQKFFSSQYRAGRKSFSIDYVIKVPEVSNLVIRNSFGNVNIDDLAGYLYVNMVHGDLTGAAFSRGNTKPVSQLDLGYVRANLGSINWMVINASHCQTVDIDKAKALVLTTEFSKVNIGNAGSVVLKSRSDNYNIVSANNLVNESVYSAIELGKLESRLQTSHKFGSFTLNNLAKGFTTAEISASGTPVTVKIDPAASFSCLLSLTSTAFEMDENLETGLNTDIKGAVKVITGLAGKDKTTKSELKINTINSLVKIGLAGK